MITMPFPSKIEHAWQVLELVYTDVCGPLNVIALVGYDYFISFIDDYLWFGYIFLTRHKSESFEKFKESKIKVKKATKGSMKTLHNDRGGDYLSNEFKIYIKEMGLYPSGLLL